MRLRFASPNIGQALLFILSCDAAGTPCVGDMAELCARQGVHCVQSFGAASDAGTWCSAKDVTHARTSINLCAGYRVVVASVGASTVWYYYDQDGGLVGAARRGDDFKPECLAGEKTFRLPEDCASSDSPHCCRYDFGVDLACMAGQDAAVLGDP
jgi:hypothetical protein